MTYVPRITDNIYTPQSQQDPIVSGHAEGGLFVAGDLVGAISAGAVATAQAVNHLSTANFTRIGELNVATQITGAISPLTNLSVGAFGVISDTQSLKASTKDADQDGIRLAGIGLFKSGLRFIMGAIGAPRQILATAIAVTKVSHAWIRITSIAGTVSVAFSGLYMLGLSIGGFYQGYQSHKYQKVLKNSDLKGRVTFLLSATEKKDSKEILQQKITKYEKMGHSKEKAEALAKKFFIKVAEKTYTDVMQKNLRALGEKSHVPRSILRATLEKELYQADKTIEDVLYAAGLDIVAEREVKNSIKKLTRYSDPDTAKYFASMSPSIRSCLQAWISSEEEGITLPPQSTPSPDEEQNTAFLKLLSSVCDNAITAAGTKKKQQIILGLAGLFGIVVSVAAGVLTAGLGPIIVGILGLLLNIIFLGIDSFFLKKSQQGEKPRKYDRLINRISASLCLIAVLTTVITVATGALTFGIGPLIIMAASFLLWGGQCIYSKYGMDKAEKIYASKHPEIGHMNDLLQRGAISEQEANASLQYLSTDDLTLIKRITKEQTEQTEKEQTEQTEKEQTEEKTVSLKTILKQAAEIKRNQEEARITKEKTTHTQNLQPLLKQINKSREAKKH